MRISLLPRKCLDFTLFCVSHYLFGCCAAVLLCILWVLNSHICHEFQCFSSAFIVSIPDVLVVKNYGWEVIHMGKKACSPCWYDASRRAFIAINFKRSKATNVLRFSGFILVNWICDWIITISPTNFWFKTVDFQTKTNPYRQRFEFSDIFSAISRVWPAQF